MGQVHRQVLQVHKQVGLGDLIGRFWLEDLGMACNNNSEIGQPREEGPTQLQMPDTQKGIRIYIGSIMTLDGVACTGGGNDNTRTGVLLNTKGF